MAALATHPNSCILVTGGAGFIGSQVVAALLARGQRVRILDCFDPFYDPAVKRSNVAELLQRAGGRLELLEGDVRDPAACQRAVAGAEGGIHLAALAGVRPSIQDPVRYLDVNVKGTQVLLDAWRSRKGAPLVFGSSSSVYGGNTKVPFAEADPVERPMSPYAASKRAGELICWTFHRLYQNPVTCLRFFTVYGPGQRPEMAIHAFTRMILEGKPLPFHGDGSSARDYTYVTDIVDGVLAALDRADGYRIYNLGGSKPTTLEALVRMLERVLGRQARLDRRPDQPGDVDVTHADVTLAERELGFRAQVALDVGLQRFAEWYLLRNSAGGSA